MSAVEEKARGSAGSSIGEPVVILVDNKIRDIERRGADCTSPRNMNVRCHLEPLEAFRAAVGAYRPGMIIFNHLNASHLASWSRRLAELGVLVGVYQTRDLYTTTSPGRSWRDAITKRTLIISSAGIG